MDGFATGLVRKVEIKQMNKIGDKIASVATPIARALGMGCIDPQTNQLRPESGCAKMRDNLNAGMNFTDAIYQRWFAVKQQGGKMKYQAIIIIESDKLTEAATKAESIGEVMAIQARPDPQQSTRTTTSQPK